MDAQNTLEQLQEHDPNIIESNLITVTAEQANASEKTGQQIEKVLMRIKKTHYSNTKNMVYAYNQLISYEQLTRFYTQTLLPHNSSCELSKNSKKNITLATSQFDKFGLKYANKESIFTTSTCALRYVKMNHPSEINRNRIQVKYKFNEKSGMITIVENTDNPIDYVLLGKLICHLLGIENINENKN